MESDFKLLGLTIAPGFALVPVAEEKDKPQPVKLFGVPLFPDEKPLFPDEKPLLPDEKDDPQPQQVKLFGIPLFPDEKADPAKKIHRGINLPPNEPDLSPEVRRDLGAASGDDVRLVFSKRLFQSDVSRGLTRLSMPKSQILNRFLSDEEERFLQGTDEKEKPLKLGIEVVDPSHRVRNLTLVRWNYDRSGKKRKREGGWRSDPGWSYMICGKWREIVECNGLRQGTWIQVWAFRRGDGALRFAIVKVEEQSAEIRDLVWGRKGKRGSTSTTGWAVASSELR